MEIENINDMLPHNNRSNSENNEVNYTTIQSDSGDMTFCISSYVKEAIKMMSMMRNHQMLTDVILEVGAELFHAHKVVLAAASPYFKAMFTGGLKECEMSRVKLQGICNTAMARLLHFMYTGEIRVTEVTVCQLLPAATMFQVCHVIDACCVFLERQLDPSNAIGIANFAEQHGCKDLYHKANRFIERHFVQVYQEDEFLQLSPMQLINLIRRDELNVQQEKDVYNAVLKWVGSKTVIKINAAAIIAVYENNITVKTDFIITFLIPLYERRQISSDRNEVKYDEENRKSKMEHILYAVRCQYLTPNFLKDQMKNCDVLKKLPACREYLAQIFKDLTLHKKPRVKERTPNTPKIIYIAGGYFKHSLDILEAYNIEDKSWTQLAKLRVPRSGLGGAFLKGMFYTVGGRNTSPGNSFDSDWVDRYNPLTDTWRSCAPMSVARSRVGVAVMDELIYAAGGSAGSEYHNTVERYDPEEDRWTNIKPMKNKRFGVGLAVVNRLLYAIGGYDGEKRLNSCECYHPENDEWTYIQPMNSSRSGAGVAALNQYIYVVGGYDGINQLKTVERYDTEKDEWEFVTPINVARSALSVSVLDDKLYAIGGFDGQSILSVVEIYNETTDTWEESTPLTSGRSGHASVVSYHQCSKHSLDFPSVPCDGFS